MRGSERLSSMWRTKGSPRAEFGLITLEWLLIVGAIAGIAASSVLAVQVVVDDSTDRPAQRDVRVIDAEIAAATVAHEATQDEAANPIAYIANNSDMVFAGRCQDVANEYSDVMDPATVRWVTPVTPPTLAACNLTRI